MIIGRHAWLQAVDLVRDDPPFYALIAAAIMKADTDNEEKLRKAFPEAWEEAAYRYNSPGGWLEGDL